MNEKMRVVGAWSDFWAVAFLGTDRRVAWALHSSQRGT